MATRIYKTPFAATGAKEALATADQPDGKVSLQAGWTLDYELANDNPNYRPVGRGEMNGVLYEVTAALGELQMSGFALWQAIDGGWPLDAIVKYSGVIYRSTEGANVSVPGDPGAAWEVFFAEVLAPIHGGTGLDYVPPGNYLVGNGTATMTSKTPGQVLRDIGAIPRGGALRRVCLTAATDANTMIADHVYYTWSNSVVMGANFPNIRGTGYLLSYYMASDHVAQELTIVGNHKPRRFGRFGNPATGVWQPWWVMSSFSEDSPMPNWDAGDIYVDWVGVAPLERRHIRGQRRSAQVLGQRAAPHQRWSCLRDRVR